MLTRPLSSARTGAFRLIIVQAVFALLIGLYLWLTKDLLLAKSALLAGLICIVPNAWFAYMALSLTGAQAMGRIVKNFFLAEAIKIFLTIVAFAMVFTWVEVDPLTLIATFFVLYLTHGLLPLLMRI